MASAFETLVNDELPNRVASQESTNTAGSFPRYTGIAKLTTERTPAEVLADIDGVAGPASSTDNDVVMFSGTTGKEIKVGTSTGAGSIVLSTSPTLASPIIANHTNATHDHSTNAGGGQLHARYRTVTKTIYIESPAATDSYPICRVPTAVTITEITGKTDVGTVDFNIEERSTEDVAGTDVNSTEIQAAATRVTDTSFANAGIASGNWLHYAASAVASSPTKLWVSVTYVID